MTGGDDYHYTESGLGNVWLRGVCRYFSAHGDGISFPDLNGLHREVSWVLVRKVGRLTGSEVRFLHIELGLPPAEFAARLGLSLGVLDGLESRAFRNLAVPSLVDERVRLEVTVHLMGQGVFDHGRDWRWWLDPVDEGALVFDHGPGGWRFLPPPAAGGDGGGIS